MRHRATEAVRWTMVLLGLVIGIASSVQAQSTGVLPASVRIVLPADGPVHVYHTETIPLGHGIHVERSLDGAPFERVTDEPIFPPANGRQFARALPADLLADLRTQLAEYERGTAPSTQADGPPVEPLSPMEVLITLRTNPASGRIATFLYPEVARALGRLYVDSTLTRQDAGREVLYRFETVTPFGNPLETLIGGSATLRPVQPRAPQALSAEVEGRRADLSWRYPTPDAGRDDGVIAFHVYRVPLDARVDGALPEAAERINRRPVLRNAATDVQTYFHAVPPPAGRARFLVQAVDLTGRTGPLSRAVTVRLRDERPPPAVPQVSADMIDDRRARVRWVPSSAADVDGYHVLRGARLDSTARFERRNRALLPATRTSFVDSLAGAVGPQAYFYRVVAVDTAGNASAPSASGLLQRPDHDAPPAPRALEATFVPGGDGSVHLTWNAPLRPPDFQTYVVQRRRRGGAPAPARVNRDDLAATELVDSGPRGGFTEGAMYVYSVSAMDSTRNVSRSAQALVGIPNQTPPSAPAGVRARQTRGTRVVVSWSPSSQADVAFYRVYRAAGSDTLAPADEVPVGALSFTDPAVPAGRSYRYAVTAVDHAGNESERSASATVTIADTDPPRRVRNPRAVVVDAGVRVSWEPVPAPDLAGYRVERAPIATGVFAPVHDALVKPTTFVDDAGAAGGFYRVRAVDAAGNESRPSDPVQALSSSSSTANDR